MTSAPDDLFAGLANPSRLRCALLLLERGELCVCEITQALGLTQPHVSRHLALLRERGLVVDRRDGHWVYYRIDPELPDWMHGVLAQARDGLAGGAPFADDLAALRAETALGTTRRCD